MLAATTLTVGNVMPLLSALLSGALITALALWRKAGAERDSIATVASKTAIEVFEGSIQRLQEDLREAQREASMLAAELAKARIDVNALIGEKLELATKVEQLRKRVTELERGSSN